MKIVFKNSGITLRKYFFVVGLLVIFLLHENRTHCMSIISKWTKSSFVWTKYPEYKEIISYMKKIADTYSEIVTLQTIGKTFEGRDMILLRVCSGKCGLKPVMWIDGGIHGRELLSPVTVLYTIKKLVENHEEHYELIEKLDWYFLPVSNPDGYVYNQPFLTKCVDDFGKLWRKNRQPSISNSSCIGTDLNRNWNFQISEESLEIKHKNQKLNEDQLLNVKATDRNEYVSQSNAPCENSFKGLTPFSAPETKNMEKFLLRHKEKIKFFNTVHCCAQVLLMPFGHTRIPIRNIKGVDRFAKKATNAIVEYHYTALVKQMRQLNLHDKLVSKISLVYRNTAIACTVIRASKHADCMIDKHTGSVENRFNDHLTIYGTLVIGIGTLFGKIEFPINIDSIPQRDVYIKYLMLIDNNQRSKNILVNVQEGSIYLGIMSSSGRINYLVRIDEFVDSKILLDLIKNVYNRKYDVGPVVPKFSTQTIAGTSMDWAHSVAKVPYTFTLELTHDRQKRYAMPSQEYIRTTGEEIWAFHQAAGRQIINEFS